MKITIALLVFLWLPAYIRSECCPLGTTLRFKVKRDKDCEDYGGQMYLIPGQEDISLKILAARQHGACKINVCGDGSRVVGFYCGHGKCNLAGCNCPGGCISGNALEEFTKLYGDQVEAIFQPGLLLTTFETLG